MTTQEPPQSSSSSAAETADLPDLANIPRATLFPPPQKTDHAILESDTQSKRGDEYLLAGDVEITYRDHKLRADTITYNDDTGDATVQGHVHLTGGVNDESIEASHGTYNLRTNTGRFYDVHGSVGMHSMADTTPGAPPPNPFLFNGRLVVKTGPQSYDVYDGDVTACLLPHPDWLLSAHHISLKDDKARAAASTFRLLNIPIVFLPYVTHPIDSDQRQSGLLIPVISQSSTKGFVIGEEVYLILGRSADLTAGFEYYSSRGFSESGTARYKGRGEDFFTARFSALQDRGYIDNTGTYINQGGQDVTTAFRYDFTKTTRAVADAEYLSSYIYREAFNNNFNQAVSSDITSIAYVTNQNNGYDLSGRFDRYQGLKRVPIGTLAGSEVHIFHAPSLDFTALDHPLPGTPLLWDVAASASGLKRVQPNFSTDGMTARFDVRPEISLPLSGDGWHTLTSLAVRETFYSRSRKAPYGPAAVPIELNSSVNRASVEADVDIRPPAIERTFQVPAKFQKFLGLEVRHTIEPEANYKYAHGVENFLSILRFDDVDLDSDTNELEYGVTQHLYFRPRLAPKLVKPGCPTNAKPAEDLPEEPQPTSSETATDANGIPTVSSVPPTRHAHHDPCAGKKEPAQQEWFSWKLAQRHFFDSTFGGAVIESRRNIFDTTLSLSGIAFLTEPRNISPLISRMRFRTSGHTDIGWDFDLDVTAQKFTSSNIYFDAHEGQLFGGFSFARLNAPGRFSTERIDTSSNQTTLISSPNSNFSQMRLLLGFGAPTKPGFSAAANAGLDLGSSGGQNGTTLQANPLLQYASLQATYNWNCCGLSVEYRKYELGSVRNEGVERFSFTLINIGSAGNLRRQERLF